MTTKVQTVSWHVNRWPITQSTYSWPEPALFIYHLATVIVDIKQTGDLLYSSGHWGHREKGCHGNRPLSGCQNCLIIQDHHCWASMRIQLEPLKRLKGEIKKLYKVVSWGIQMKLPWLHMPSANEPGVTHRARTHNLKSNLNPWFDYF